MARRKRPETLKHLIVRIAEAMSEADSPSGWDSREEADEMAAYYLDHARRAVRMTRKWMAKGSSQASLFTGGSDG